MSYRSCGLLRTSPSRRIGIGSSRPIVPLFSGQTRTRPSSAPPDLHCKATPDRLSRECEEPAPVDLAGRYPHRESLKRPQRRRCGLQTHIQAGGAACPRRLGRRVSTPRAPEPASKAAMRSATSHPSRCEIIPPLENPVAYTLLGSILT